MAGDVGDTSGQVARMWSLTHKGILRSLLVHNPQCAHPRNRQHGSEEGNFTQKQNKKQKTKTNTKTNKNKQNLDSDKWVLSPKQ